MPIMAHHEQSSNYSSPSSSGFIYNNSTSYGSPESPTTTTTTLNSNRKRKQEQQQQQPEFHFNGVSDTMYLSYPSSWNHSAQQQQQQQQDFIVPMSSSSSSTTYQPHQQDDLLQKNSLISSSWQQNEPFLENNNYNSFMSTTTHQKTVGENNSNEIHQILNLDQFTTKSTRSALQLNDTRLMHQPWSPQQNAFQTNSGGGANSPGFFTPGFLESLQEDESESNSSFPFHVPATIKNWHTEQNKPNNNNIIEHDPSTTSAATVERTFVSQENNMPLTLFHSGPSSPIPSSSSSSSPPTYIHKFSTPPPIMEEQPSTLMMDHRRSLQVDVMNARLLQHAMNTAKMKPLIQHYLSGRGEEKTVVILTSKVAQKSYGTEKRFLCPPPTAILVGTSWWTKHGGGGMIENTNEILKRGQEEFNPPKLTVNISGETTTAQSGHIEWYTVSGVTVGQTGHVKPQQQPTSNLHSAEHPSRFRSSSESRSNSIDWYQNHHQELLSAGKCVSKHLYINDADEKRKRVECIIKIQLANGLSLGSLASKGIKVISKPSKKRQSVKNMELCIHHGTTVSLFNRIRSQTVSTKYLGVSTAGSPFTFPGQQQTTTIDSAPTVGEGTCFVARTTCWDPFVIWIVDTTRTPGDAKDTDTPEDFIGKSSTFVRNIKYPPPPAIALKNKSGQLIPIHYNQHVVLQCLTTGLVSPVMIIRKVDKASTVVGGAKCLDDLNLLGGGEYGDEVLGDPVSQLHKVALQIVQDPANANQRQQPPSNDYYRAPSTPGMPRTSHPVTYLACLNDMVGMHKTTDPRKLIHPPAPPPQAPSNSNSTMNWDVLDMFDVTAQDEKVIRKRRVSVTNEHSMMMQQQQRYNNNDDYYPNTMPPPQSKLDGSRKSSISSNSSSTGRRSSVSGSNNQTLGAYWNEDVSDAAVWTIVGTDCATYTFCSPSPISLHEESNSHPITTNSFPSLTSFTTKTKEDELYITLHGENFSRDIQVWFGDKKALQTDYRSRELLMCKVPLRNDLLETKTTFGDIPILLVRGDGTICKTNKFYSL